jgi:hypothetical protein
VLAGLGVGVEGAGGAGLIDVAEGDYVFRDGGSLKDRGAAGAESDGRDVQLFVG